MKPASTVSVGAKTGNAVEHPTFVSEAGSTVSVASDSKANCGAVEGERLGDRRRSAIGAHQDEAKQSVTGGEEQLGERLGAVRIRKDRLSIVVADLLERVGGEVGLDSSERVQRTAGIDALVLPGVCRAGDFRRSDAFWQVPGQLVLAAIRDRQVDRRERALLGSGVGDGFLLLGHSEQLLSAERDDPIEQEPGVGDHKLARHTLGLPAIAEPVDELDASVDLPGRRTRRPGHHARARRSKLADQQGQHAANERAYDRSLDGACAHGSPS